MASTHTVRVLEESRVSPPPNSVAKASVPLTSFDMQWLLASPVERLFFYRSPHPTTYFVKSQLPILKTSLSFMLQHFYTLAGNLRPTPGSDDKFEIYYTEGDAVNFTVAESDGDFNELSGGEPREFIIIRPLVPKLSSSSATSTMTPLLAIQVTVFPNHGICLGVSIHHSACDGSCTIRFLKSWASACRSGGLVHPSPPPIYDRTLIPQPHGITSLNKAVPSSDSSAQPNVVLASFTLGLDHIQRLKQIVVASSVEPFNYTTFIVSCAYVWICLARARRYNINKEAHFLFPVDCRGRLEPPVPASYFGNCLRTCFVVVNVEELVSEDGLVAASIAFGRVIEEMNDGVLNGADGWGEKIRSVVGEQLVTVAGSPKFKVYDTDFGWGRPERVEIPSIMKTGAISLTEARDDGGGLEIGIALEKNEMDEFQTHFYNGLK